MGNRKPIECPTCSGALHRDESGVRCAECGSQFLLVKTAGPAVLAPAKEGQAQVALRNARHRLATLVEKLAKLSARPSEPACAPNLNPPKSYTARVALILLPCFVLTWVFGSLLAAIVVLALPLFVAGIARSRTMKRFRQEVVDYHRRQGEVSETLQKKRAIEIEGLVRERNECGDLVHRIASRVSPGLT